MKPGDLVTVENCGGHFDSFGSLRCSSAIVLSVELSHSEQVQVDSHAYTDRDIYECELMCRCGMFEEYADRLEMLSESR